MRRGEVVLLRRWAVREPAYVCHRSPAHGVRYATDGSGPREVWAAGRDDAKRKGARLFGCEPQAVVALRRRGLLGETAWQFAETREATAEEVRP